MKAEKEKRAKTNDGLVSTASSNIIMKLISGTKLIGMRAPAENHNIPDHANE
jgi:hypothetical protein